MRELVVSVISVGVLAACGGGGGGGGDSSWLTFDRSPIQVTVYEGEDAQVTVTGIAKKRPDSQPYVGMSVDGAYFDPDSFGLSWGGSLGQEYSVRLRPTISVGTHDTEIVLLTCLDSPSICAQPYGGSPFHLPVHMTVEPDPGNPTTPANGDFAAGTTGWATQVLGDGAASLSATGGELHVDIANGGSSSDAIQLHDTAGIDLVKGKRYRLSFQARADAARTIEAYLVEGRDRDGDHEEAIYCPQTLYCESIPFSLTTSMQPFSYSFDMRETNRAVQTLFLLGGSDVDVYIDDVTVTELSP